LEKIYSTEPLFEIEIFLVVFINKTMTSKSKLSATKLREGLFYNRSDAINSSGISFRHWPKTFGIGFGININKFYFLVKHND
jgi:hypothetical protein